MTWGRARPDVGDEVLVRLRRGPKTASIPDVTPEPTKRLLAAGAHSYLTKPISVWSFIEVVDGNLQRSSEKMSPSEPQIDKILIVDDEQANVSLLERLLEESGLRQHSGHDRPDAGTVHLRRAETGPRPLRSPHARPRRIRRHAAARWVNRSRRLRPRSSY